MERYIGMYVHTHWAYNRPYCARTWTMEDWRSYAAAMSKLGYNLFMIWPMTETVPDPPTPSDVAQFEFYGRITTMLQEEFGMAVIFTLAPNVMGSDMASRYTWAERPYFLCDQRLNPADPRHMGRLMSLRRKLIRHIAHADGFAMIDSDPGGYIGSTNDEFADILETHIEMLREINHKSVLYYWMWAGWETYNRFWQQARDTGEVSFAPDERDWDTVVRRLMRWPDDSWGVFSCNPMHQSVLERLGVAHKALFLPYGLIEGEPNYPHTNLFPESIYNGLKHYLDNDTYLGCMGNCQTHAVQQPNTYLFSQIAQGAKPADVDLVAFADDLVPGMSSLIIEAWTSLNTTDYSDVRDLAIRLDAKALDKPPCGPLSGLLFGSPKMYLQDLALQVRFAADLWELRFCLDAGGDWRPSLASLADSFDAWARRTGFIDAYYGQLAAGLHPLLSRLGNPEMDAVLADFNNWRNPSVRHGIVTRLLAAIRTCAR